MTIQKAQESLSLQAKLACQALSSILLAASLIILSSNRIDAQCTNYNISVTGGAGAGQVSWQLFNSSNVMVLSGGAPFNQNVCLPDGCYTLWMYDSANNGWQNQDWFIADFIGDFDYDTNLPDGSSGSDQFYLGDGNCNATPCPLGTNLYTIDVDDGNDAGDVYWELYDSFGSLVAAGGAPDVQELCLPDDCYTLWMYDSSCDGWDNETWKIDDENGNLLFSTFLFSGCDGFETFAIGGATCAPPCQIFEITTTDGVDGFDAYWELYDSFGVLQAFGGPNETQFVCLLDDCYSLVLYDFAGDGWSEVVLSFSEPNSGFFYQTFLVSGAQTTETLAIGNVTCTTPVTCPAGTSEYTFNVTAGPNPAEISWYFSLNNGITQGGGAPYNGGVCLGNGCYYLHMFDSAGDGWNGATYTLADPLGNVIQSGSMAAGTSEWVLVNIGGLDCTGTEPPTGGACGSSPPSSDCFAAPCVCDVYNFHITPSGFGAIDEVPPPGSVSNPSYSGTPPPWGGTDFGCLLAGELNSSWMMFTVATSGTLEFSFGAGGQQQGYYDWAMWPYTGAASCNGISNNTLPPARCVWNAAPFGGAGLASVIPPGGDPGNYGPPLNVVAGQQYVICMSNWSYVDAMVTLDFFGTASIACSLTLPVEMLEFNGHKASDGVFLHWKTLSEIDNDYFVVEHSTDLREWIEIGQVDGHGTTFEPQRYSFTDHYPHLGHNYYRLRQVDFNGMFKVTPVVNVDYSGMTAISCKPNPANDRVIIDFPNDDQPVDVTIHDMDGKIVREYRAVTSFPFEMNTADLAPAGYFVRCQTAFENSVARLIIML